MITYEIQTRPAGSNDHRAWTTDGIGDPDANVFDSPEEAWLTIAHLLGMGGTWARAEYRVVDSDGNAETASEATVARRGRRLPRRRGAVMSALDTVRDLNRRYNANPTPELKSELTAAQRAYERERSEAAQQERLARVAAEAGEIRETIRERLARDVVVTGDLVLVSQETAEYLMMAPSRAGGFVAVNLDLQGIPSAGVEPRAPRALLADLAGLDAPTLGSVPRAAVAADLRERLHKMLAWQNWVLVDYGEADHLIAHLDLVEGVQ